MLNQLHRDAPIPLDLHAASAWRLPARDSDGVSRRFAPRGAGEADSNLRRIVNFHQEIAMPAPSLAARAATIHATAQIEPGAMIGRGKTIGPCCVIGADVGIGVPRSRRAVVGKPGTADPDVLWLVAERPDNVF